MAHKSNNFSVLQVDSHGISMIRCRRSSKRIEVVESLSQRGDWSLEGGELQEALATFAKDHNLGDTPLYTVLPRHGITARILQLPSADLEEIKSMIRLSAEEYVPFAQSELVIDECILRKSSDGYSRVLAVFAQKEGIESHVALLRGAGLEPEDVFFSTSCLASAVSAARCDVPERFGLAYLGPGSIEVLIMGAQGLEYNRAVASVQDWSLESGQAEEAVEEFIVELRTSLSAHRRESEDGLGAEMAYVSSDRGDSKAICEAAAHELTVECSPAPFGAALVAGPKEGTGSAPLVLLGAALSAQDRAAFSISLMPPSVLTKRERASAKKRLVQGVALAAAVVLLACGLFAQAVWQRTRYLDNLEARVAAIKPKAESTLIKQRQLRILREQVVESSTVMELLAKITELAPAGTSITRFSYDLDTGITVEGHTRSENLAYDFVDALRGVKDQYPLLALAQSGGSRVANEFGQTVYNYVINIPFPESKAPEAPLPKGTSPIAQSNGNASS